jgi:hypothetical protein
MSRITDDLIAAWYDHLGTLPHKVQELVERLELNPTQYYVNNETDNGYYLVTFLTNQPNAKIILAEHNQLQTANGNLFDTILLSVSFDQLENDFTLSREVRSDLEYYPWETFKSNPDANKVFTVTEHY